MHIYLLQWCPSNTAQYEAQQHWLSVHTKIWSARTLSASKPSEEPHTKRHQVSIIREKLLLM